MKRPILKAVSAGAIGPRLLPTTADVSQPCRVYCVEELCAELVSAPDGTLIGHVALANDMHRMVADGQEVLAIFRGEDAYVSPNFYPPSLSIIGMSRLGITRSSTPTVRSPSSTMSRQREQRWGC